ncbi:hypothetical protein CBD41_08850 [bacterium TMED181]|nr:MAG: hypothetical protein CBD41_08850 [bacterium TMED181]
MDRLALIKQIAEKKAEEKSFQQTIKNLDARKAALKEKTKLHKKLTRSMKKAGHQSVGNLELNAPENMYYSDKDTARFLENSSIMDAYNAQKFTDDWS